jgi:hypothetical protein
MERTKTDFLRYLDSLGSYIEAGIWDYLRETDFATYIAVGGLEHDLELRKAVMTLRRFVAIDDFPWWEEFDGATPAGAASSTRRSKLPSGRDSGAATTGHRR